MTGISLSRLMAGSAIDPIGIAHRKSLERTREWPIDHRKFFSGEIGNGRPAFNSGNLPERLKISITLRDGMFEVAAIFRP
jgi:hypothetical protein